MAADFDAARHIVCLGYALEAMISCALSFLEPRSTMIGHGFPKRIANDSATWPVYKLAQTRSWVIGVLMFMFYFRGHTEIVDTIMAVSSAHEAVFDCYILYSGGEHCACSFSLRGASVLCYLGIPWNELYSCCSKGSRAASLTLQL